MQRKILILYPIIIAAIVLVAVFFIFYFNNKLSASKEQPSGIIGNPPAIGDLMAIIKKSPDYPDFLKIIKSDNFDPELIEYYNISPELYAEKSAELEASSNGDKELKNKLDAVKIGKDSFFVKLQSKSNPDYGLTAIIDMKNKEPQFILVNIKIEAKVGF